MNAGRKKKGRRGFTLAETLLTVLILMLVSTIVATGVPAAANAYEKVVISANANALLSTTIAALRDELTTAQNVRVIGTRVYYYNTANGSSSIIDLNGIKSVPWLYEYQFFDSLGNKENEPVGDGRGLVPEKAATDKLKITCSIPTCSSSTSSTETCDMITFPEIKVTREGSDKALASVKNLVIRLLVPSPVV